VIQPLDDRLIVERIITSGYTLGGIFLPETAQDKPNRGVVKAVGPGKMFDSGQRQPLNVNIGDTVALAKWAGMEVEVDGSKVEIFRESEIIGKLID
jgi:chaperonin GroES